MTPSLLLRRPPSGAVLNTLSSSRRSLNTSSISRLQHHSITAPSTNASRLYNTNPPQRRCQRKSTFYSSGVKTRCPHGLRQYHSGSSSFSPLSPSSSPSSQFSPEQLSILSTAVSRHVPELGFTREALAQAAQDVGYLDVSLHLFPHGGEIELVLYWLSSRRALLKERAESGEVFGGTAEADCIGVDEKVKMLIIDRLKMNSDLVHHWQDALAIMSLPSNIPSSLTELYELSSDILYLAGDRSVDSSWYSRRLAVSTVYASAEIFMTEDASTDFASTQEFVDRRVKDSRAISGVLGDVKTYLGYVAGSLVAAGRSWGMKV